MTKEDFLYLMGDDPLIQDDEAFVDSFIMKPTPQVLTKSGNPVSIVTSGAQNAISTILSFSPKQSGSGDPSPQNIRPIEGWTEANLFRNSGNFWDEVWEVGGIDSQTGQDVPQSDRIRSKNYMPIKGGLNYYVRTNGKTLGFRFYDGVKNYIGYVTAFDSVVSVPSTAIYFRFILLGTTEYGDDVSINYPSTDTEYHAYQGTDLTISLGGTYYGFSIDVERGVLRVTHAIVDLGSLEWVYDSTNRLFATNVSGAYYAGLRYGAPCLCTSYLSAYYKPSTSWAGFFDKTIACGSNYGATRNTVLKDLDYTDPVVLKAVLDGVKLVYELATPLELPLTPQTVALLAGNNTLWTDGDNIEITYTGYRLRRM